MDFLLYIQALIQGIVEGVTEFLPISSTGHMILVDAFFPMRDAEFAKRFEVIIQLGAILSVLVHFRKIIFPSKWTIDGFKSMMPLWLRIVAGVIPAAVLGFLLDDFIEAKLFNLPVVTSMLVLWGIVLVFSGLIEKRSQGNSADKIVLMSWIQVLAVGFAQCLAMVPGTSRSAVTILGAMCLGCTRSCAAEFSFFLAIPTMFGATLLSLVKSGANFTANQWVALTIGFLAAFFTAWGVIAWFMDYIKKHDFKLFGWYRIILGIAVFTLYLLFK